MKNCRVHLMHWLISTQVTILSIYFNEAIMVQENGEYKPHSFSRSGLYKPASVGPLQEHTDYFSSLPQIDEPEIFGMHENANITFNRAESSTLMSSILALQPREGGGGGGNLQTRSSST